MQAEDNLKCQCGMKLLQPTPLLLQNTCKELLSASVYGVLYLDICVFRKYI